MAGYSKDREEEHWKSRKRWQDRLKKKHGKTER
jgi:hypothetical protein